MDDTGKIPDAVNQPLASPSGGRAAGRTIMQSEWLKHQLTDQEREAFDRDGYFLVENAISEETVARANAAVDRLIATYRDQEGLEENARINYLDFIGRDREFMDLLDCPTTFPKVWNILGWNIQLYHSHLIWTPPLQPGEPDPGYNWHKDSGRLNQELETDPQPRISLKVAYFLTDTSVPGRANLYVVPGSHLTNKLEDIVDGQPRGGMPVLAKPGTAVFFDRRIFHASSPNTSDVTRKVLFYGYSYRWLRPRDDMRIEEWLDDADPIQKQLLGISLSGGHGYSSPQEEDVPLRAWMREQLGSASVPA